MAFRRIVHKLLFELHGFFIKGWGYCYCCFFCGMKRTKKSCGGDVRAAPRRVSAEKTDGKQAPPSDFFITPTVLSWRPPLTSPPPEEKVASRRKKSASPKKNCAYSKRRERSVQTIFSFLNESVVGCFVLFFSTKKGFFKNKVLFLHFRPIFY